jgi:hypothetical protein
MSGGLLSKIEAGCYGTMKVEGGKLVFESSGVPPPIGLVPSAPPLVEDNHRVIFHNTIFYYKHKIDSVIFNLHYIKDNSIIMIYSFFRLLFRIVTMSTTSDASTTTPVSEPIDDVEMENDASTAEMYWPLTIKSVSECDLSYFNDKWSEDMIRDGMRAILRAGQLPQVKSKEINVWKYLSEYSPPEGRGFQFSAGDDDIVSLVQYQMEVGHSGCSMGWTMRNIEFIAKNGLPAHRELFLANHRRRSDSSGDY